MRFQYSIIQNMCQCDFSYFSNNAQSGGGFNIIAKRKGGDLMLGEKALEYHKNGISCAECIFRACEDIYKTKLPETLYYMCPALTNGFGAGSICSAAATGAMFLAYRFKNNKTVQKQARILYLAKVSEKLDTIDCCKLNKDCAHAIYTCGDLLEEVINSM